MNIAQATTSGSRIGRGAESDFAARLLQFNNVNNGYLLSHGLHPLPAAKRGREWVGVGTKLIYPFFSGEGMTLRIGRLCGIALVPGFFALNGCSGAPTLVENSAMAVTVRYNGISDSLADATKIAQKACADHGKIARLRKVSDQGLGQHFGHFDCISANGLN